MIHVLMIYEKVNLVLPIEQRRFFNYLNDTLTELAVKYAETNPKLLFCSRNDDEENSCFDDIPIVRALDEYIPILSLYVPAIVDNILFLAGAGEGYKNEFLRKSDETYNSYWRKNAKSGHIKRMAW